MTPGRETEDRADDGVDDRAQGRASRACQELVIHRNTLGYRLRKLESLLGLRLDTLEGQTTSLLALRIYE